MNCTTNVLIRQRSYWIRCPNLAYAPAKYSSLVYIALSIGLPIRWFRSALLMRVVGQVCRYGCSVETLHISFQTNAMQLQCTAADNYKCLRIHTSIYWTNSILLQSSNVSVPFHELSVGKSSATCILTCRIKLIAIVRSVNSYTTALSLGIPPSVFKTKADGTRRNISNDRFTLRWVRCFSRRLGPVFLPRCPVARLAAALPSVTSSVYPPAPPPKGQCRGTAPIGTPRGGQ